MSYNPQNSNRTAIHRTNPSRPLQILLQKDQIQPTESIIDYGCGRGIDVQYLRSLGFYAFGYDPYQPEWSSENPLYGKYDVVLNFYVLNVLLPEERIEVLENIKNLLHDYGRLYIAVRDTKETVRGEPYADGVITSKGTFQKLFREEELLDTLVEAGFVEFRIIKHHPLLVEAKVF